MSSTYFKTCSYAFVPFGTFIPHAFLAEDADTYCGFIPRVLKHIQDTIPLNLDKVDKVWADEKPDRKD